MEEAADSHRMGDIDLVEAVGSRREGDTGQVGVRAVRSHPAEEDIGPEAEDIAHVGGIADHSLEVVAAGRTERRIVDMT